jgi:hypothetical protein
LKLRVNKDEIIWSIPILIVLGYLIYYGIKARRINDECFSFCAKFTRIYGWKLDGDFWGSFFLDKNKMYCACYYPNSNFTFANATIAQLELTTQEVSS